MADQRGPLTFSCGGADYQCVRMSAVEQLDVLAKLSPMIAAGLAEIIPLVMSVRESGGTSLFDQPIESIAHLAPVMREFAKMEAGDRMFIIESCLRRCQRRIMTGQKEQWAPVWAGQGKAMFDDLNNDLATLLAVVWHIILGTFTAFFTIGLSTLSGEARG